jgi:hypothetical protein
VERDHVIERERRSERVGAEVFVGDRSRDLHTVIVSGNACGTPAAMRAPTVLRLASAVTEEEQSG